MGQNESTLGAGALPPDGAIANPPVPPQQQPNQAAAPPLVAVAIPPMPPQQPIQAVPQHDTIANSAIDPNEGNRPKEGAAEENKKKSAKKKPKGKEKDDKNGEEAKPENAPVGVDEVRYESRISKGRYLPEPVAPLLEDASEEAVVANSAAKAESSESGTSTKSDKSDKSKHSTHGSWDYVPAPPVAAYPKGKPTSKVVRALMSLSSDLVDQAPITLGRRPREIRRPEPEVPVVKEKKAKKASKKKEGKKKATTKHRKAEDGSAASTSRSSVAEDDGDSDTSEELGTSYNDYMKDMNENNNSSRAHSSDTVDQPSERRAYISTYSSPSPVQSSFAELPEDILEPEQDPVPAPVVKPVPNTYLAMVLKRLPSGQALADLETSFDDHGVLFKPRLLCIPSIPESLSMKELMEDVLGSDHLYLIPTLRPSVFKKGHVALMFATKEEAESMLHNKAKLVVNGSPLNVEQPGAVLVRVNNESAVGEMELQELIKGTYCELILDMQRTPFGTLLLLPSMQQARDLIKAGHAGDLIFSAPRDELGGELSFDWPSIDSNWAEELGLKH